MKNTSIAQSFGKNDVDTAKFLSSNNIADKQHESSFNMKDIGTKKGEYNRVNISSDDEEPFANFKENSTKKTAIGPQKRRSTAIKIKKEKN